MSQTDPPDRLTVEIIGGTGRRVGDRVRLIYFERGAPLRLEPDPDGPWTIEAVTESLPPSTGGARPIPGARLLLRRVAADPR